MSLEDLLSEYKRGSRQGLAEEKRRVLEEHVRQLQLSGIASTVLKVGSKAPNFALLDHRGDEWELAAALACGPVVLKFYRGTWCPYCNIELRAYQLKLTEIRQRGAAFVAISPEKPDFSQAFIAKEQIEFPVLTDSMNVVAQQFGLVFVVDEALQQLMREFGNSLPEKNGDFSWTLPLPGTFVISSGGRIEYSFAEPDFTIRADPGEVLAVLDNL